MLYLHHSNQLKNLSDILLLEMNRHQGAVLKPVQILVQNPGMKRWLQQNISRTAGIAANLNFPLPSRFIWDVFLSQFDGMQNISAYDAEVLRWRLFKLLQTHQQEERFSMLNAYQRQDEKGIASFQLAEKMAGLFDQYLVYRPQMIESWEQGKTSHSKDERWQADLWQLLREQLTESHRAELIKRLIGHLKSDAIKLNLLPDCLYVFGISAMSPLYLNVLAVLGQHIDVHIFNLNPCLHYWGDIESKKEKLKQGQMSGVDNEILASLGKQGRDFIDQFYETGSHPIEQEYFDDRQPSSLLQQVKYDILTLSVSDKKKPYKDDNSIQVVSCYSELRELQVLHDRLLDMLEQDETLQADEIVVMCPDINTLTPFIDAVFGQQQKHKKIPYSISDNDVLSSTPLLQTIIQWIGLAGSRFSASEIMGWLELPALCRRYEFDDQSVQMIRYWVTSHHVHWGLDARHKQALQLGKQDINTWWHAISALLSAYIMDDQQAMFNEHALSNSLMSNEEFRLLGQLDKLLSDLRTLSSILNKKNTLSQWQNIINELINNLLLLDDDEEWLIKPLRDEIAAWTLQAQQAGFEQPVDALFITQLLHKALSRGSSHHHYLTGGINFCNLIPMRTLPFRVVCLIGLGEDRFPASEIPLQFDLISRNPKKGDRSRREDDRYMFLQSLLSSEDYFYISYVGQDKKDDSGLEPSVVVREFIDHVKHSTGHELKIEQTALQPFSHENYCQGSYSEQWYVGSMQNKPEAFNQPLDEITIHKNLELGELISFYKNPAKYFMEKQLNMTLSEYEEAIQDVEDYTLDPLLRSCLYHEMLDEKIEFSDLEKSRYLKSGALAEQSFGELQFEGLKNNVDAMADKLEQNNLFEGPTKIDIEVECKNINLSASIQSYSSQGLLMMNPSNVSGKYILDMWIKHCALCAAGFEQGSEFYFKDRGKNFYHHKTYDLLGKDDAVEELNKLIQGYMDGQQQALAFFTNTAYEYEEEKNKNGEQAARNKISKLWTQDEYNKFYESRDTYITTSLKNSGFNKDNFPQAFFEASQKYMSSCVQQMSSKKS